MQDGPFKNWSKTEKKAARRAFDLALGREFAEIRAKAREMLDTPDEPRIIWKVREYLNERGKFVDDMYDFRYSVLANTFALLVRDGRLTGEELEGLDREKIESIVETAKVYARLIRELADEKADEEEA